MARRIQTKDKYLFFCPDSSGSDKFSEIACPIQKTNSERTNPIIGKIIWAKNKFLKWPNTSEPNALNMEMNCALLTQQ